MYAAHDSKETVSNTREINLTGEEVLNKERGEDTSRAGRAARTIAVMIKDTRIQRQLPSTQATFVQTWLKHARNTSTPGATQLCNVLRGTAPCSDPVCPPRGAQHCAQALCALLDSHSTGLRHCVPSQRGTALCSDTVCPPREAQPCAQALCPLLERHRGTALCSGTVCSPRGAWHCVSSQMGIALCSDTVCPPCPPSLVLPVTRAGIVPSALKPGSLCPHAQGVPRAASSQEHLSFSPGCS